MICTASPSPASPRPCGNRAHEGDDQRVAPAKVRSVLKQRRAPAGSVYLDPVTTSEAAVLHDSAPRHPVVGDSNGRLAGELAQASGAGACGEEVVLAHRTPAP
jgi:hypothetical protein